MADSDTGRKTLDELWIPYKCREDWKDIDPVLQNDGSDPVVAIAYSEKFIDVYNYFRAVLQRDEMSERALALTADALKLNAANYTVWQYRRVLLKNLKKDLTAELTFAKALIKRNPKNYQVWHHRRVICEWLGVGATELVLTADCLAGDPKNYHAWQHRQWAIRTFQLYDEELEFVDRLLETDVRNNSAWNQRYFVVTRGAALAQGTALAQDTLDRELDVTLAAIEKAPHNESAWSYLRGILALAESDGAAARALARCEDVHGADPTSPHALAFLVDACAARAAHDPAARTRALQLCKQLAEKHDTIRAAYWRYMARSIKGK